MENGKEVFHSELHENLPSEIEHRYPDYSLFPQYQNTAYGFLTRGCCNNCSFCIVCPKEGNQSVQVADLSEFWNGQREIKLLDPNLLACRNRETLLKELIESGARVDFTQGIDARFITSDIAELINQVKIKTIHFAFDYEKREGDHSRIRVFQEILLWLRQKYTVLCFDKLRYFTRRRLVSGTLSD